MLQFYATNARRDQDTVAGPQVVVPRLATERLDLLGDFQMIEFEYIHWRKIGSLKDEAGGLAVQAKATGRSFQPALNHLCDFGS
jgi:hypothetical protein